MNSIFRFLFLSLCCIIAYHSSAQQGQWTWMAGQNTMLQAPVYGTQGVPSPTNTPGYRYESMRWTDSLGNLWLFGGQCALGTMSDLWRFDINTYEWTWMAGPDVPYAQPVYGAQGVFNSANLPTGTMYSSTEFTDKDHNFWILEGDFGQNLLKFDVSINQWAFMNGPGLNSSCYPSFGTQGVFSPSNYPASMNEHHGGWCDEHGNLWMYGGNQSIDGSCSDVLWEYDTQLNQWAWIFGTPNTFVPAIHGIQDIEDPANTPGSRNIYATWRSSENELYLYGHGGFCGVEYIDFWKYNISSGYWTWVSGVDSTFTQSLKETRALCQPSRDLYPIRRSEMHTNAQYNDCNIFYYYGWGGNSSEGIGNTLWQYSARTDEWIMLRVDSISPNYGTFQSGDPTVSPGSHFGSVAWADHQNNYWLYGNQVTEYAAVMWRYSPEPTTVSFTSDSLICPGDTVFFHMDIQSGCGLVGSINWNFGDPSSGVNNYSVLENPYHIYTHPGNYLVTLAGGACASAADTAYKTITVGDDNDSLCYRPIPCVETGELPNVFTPNGDGLNDNFQIITSCPYSLQIFDRWGTLVWSTDTGTDVWNGNNQKNDKPVSSGTYYYLFSPEINGQIKTYKGFVTVIR